MVMLQVDLSRQMSRKLSLLKVLKGFKTKTEALEYLIGSYEFNEKYESEFDSYTVLNEFKGDEE